MRIVHLVAPQIWAWGRWRIHKVRRLTDMLLCLLPFEERFFSTRDVPATFIGHPLFDPPLDGEDLDRRAARIGPGERRVALMPGSRPGEMNKNFPLLLAVFRRIQAELPDVSGVVAATRPEVADHLRSMAASLGGWPERLYAVAGDTDAAIRWCQMAVTVSGTVSLQIARQQRPMVIVYKMNPIGYWLVAKWVLSTKFFTLPNLIAGRRIVPEFVPYFGGPEPIARAALDLLRSPELLARQRADLSEVVAQFSGRNASAAAAIAIERVGGMTSPARTLANV
jgi:lipid-A-disaccharide synthase